MDNLEQKARQDIPELRHWADCLLVLANTTMEGVSYSENDHFGFMTLCFLSKQICHMESILILNQSRDVVLIARSMIEGLCQLLWADRDPDTLGLQWRTYSYIHDWRVMQGKITAGEPVDRETRTKIETGLRQYGDQFLRPEARKKRDKGDPLPKDPYRKSWTKHQVRQICKKVECELLYLRLYGPFFDYHHWSPGGLGTAINRQQDQVVYSSGSPEDEATALATGFQCLLQTVEIVDKHLELATVVRIAELKDGFIAWYKAQHGF